MSSTLILSLFQSFFFRETNFYFYQFLSNFLRYYFLNFLSFYLYYIFAVYFSSNSSLLKFFSSIIANFLYLFTSILNLSSNSITTSFVFSKFFHFSQVPFSAINPFYYTKYFTTSLIFLWFRIFSTFYSLTPSTSTNFASFTFYSPTCSLYYTTQLTFTTR